MSEILEWNFSADSRFSDLHGYLRASALLGCLQETSVRHAAQLGLDITGMREKQNAFWMLVRLWFALDEPIVSETDFQIRTWYRGTKKASLNRDYDIVVDGKVIGEGTSIWVIASRQEDHHMIRPGHIPELAESSVPAVVKSILPPKIQMPSDMVFVGRRRVRYSDTDMHGHMNNTRYADIACDAAGMAEIKGAYVREMGLCYQRECFVGEDITVMKAEADDRTYVRGTDRDGKDRFDIYIKLGQKVQQL